MSSSSSISEVVNITISCDFQNLQLEQKKTKLPACNVITVLIKLREKIQSDTLLNCVRGEGWYHCEKYCHTGEISCFCCKNLESKEEQKCEA